MIDYIPNLSKLVASQVVEIIIQEHCKVFNEANFNRPFFYNDLRFFSKAI